MIYPQQTFETQDIVAFLEHRYSHAPGRFTRYMSRQGIKPGDSVPSSLVEEWFNSYFEQRAKSEFRSLQNRVYEKYMCSIG